MSFPHSLTSKQREQLYESEAEVASAAGRGEFPICRLCDLAILPGQSWDTNHEGHKPKWLGGKIDGISHRRCNALNARAYATPLYAKSERIRKRHLDFTRSRSPMPGGRDDSIKKTMSGKVVSRSDGASLVTLAPTSAKRQEEEEEAR